MANTGTDTATAQLNTQGAFDTVHKYVALFGAVGVIVLGTVAVMAFTGHEANPFMWIRGTILLLVTYPLHRFAVRASQGEDKAFDRLRTLATVLPIAIIAVDLIPGLCPAWYAVLQGLSALALIGVAVLTRGSALTAAFPAPGKK
ncbi:hypothetical protein [Actinomadura hibisca]|uniref:hypothetical protein n=1 Tax=Actinomadura hibisca TaxID=68565 RepID=UPI000833C2C7|nr:hypothetical protein [Actinomadura hibisca]